MDKKGMIIIIAFLLVINIIAYLVKNSSYASEYGKSMNNFTIPILTIIGTFLGLLMRELLVKILDIKLKNIL